MRPEEIHDAIGELPEELLMPVEALRKKKKIHWVRWTGLAAACLLILLAPLALPLSRDAKSESAAKGELTYSRQESEKEADLNYGGIQDTVTGSFRARVLELREGGILVCPLETEPESNSASKVFVSFQLLDTVPEIAVEDTVEIVYSGILRESYPAEAVDVRQIRVVQ